MSFISPRNFTHKDAYTHLIRYRINLHIAITRQHEPCIVIRAVMRSTVAPDRCGGTLTRDTRASAGRRARMTRNCHRRPPRVETAGVIREEA